MREARASLLRTSPGHLFRSARPGRCGTALVSVIIAPSRQAARSACRTKTRSTADQTNPRDRKPLRNVRWLPLGMRAVDPSQELQRLSEQPDTGAPAGNALFPGRGFAGLLLEYVSSGRASEECGRVIGRAPSPGLFCCHERLRRAAVAADGRSSRGILALPHQITVLERQLGAGARVRFAPEDRAFPPRSGGTSPTRGWRAQGSDQRTTALSDLHAPRSGRQDHPPAAALPLRPIEDRDVPTALPRRRTRAVVPDQPDSSVPTP